MCFILYLNDEKESLEEIKMFCSRVTGMIETVDTIGTGMDDFAIFL